MKIETGYLYYIKDEFFDKININGLMINHENGRSRPTYFTIRERDILWFIPLSSNISKYKKIIKDKEEKYGVCRSIMVTLKKQSMNGWNAITYNHYYSRKDVHSWQNVFIPMTIL